MKKFIRLLFIIAVFFSLSNFVKVNADSGSINVELTAIFDEANEIKHVGEKAFGTKIQLDNLLDFEDYTFAFWIVNGVVRKDLPVDHSFTVTSKMNLYAIFTPSDKYVVLFMDSNGQLLDTQFVTNTAVDPSVDLPSKPGLEIAETKWRSLDGVTSLENITKNTVFLLQYQKISEDTYYLNVHFGSGTDTYNFNDIVTIIADPDSEGSFFSHWEENGKIISYERSYTFSILENRLITAVFTEEATNLEAPLVILSGDLHLRDGFNSYLGQYFLPTGYELIEFGILTSLSLGEITLDSLGITRYQVFHSLEITNEFVVSVRSNTHNSVRAYIVYSFDDELYTIYNEVNLPDVSGSTDFEIDTTNDVVLNVDLNSNTFSTVSYLGEDLVEGVDYTYNVVGNVVTLKGSLLTYIYRFDTTEYPFIIKTLENSNVGINVVSINPQNRILNGGFETGNLYGWNSYSIWKGESGMVAWTDERVVSGGYFDQNFAYNRDGNYNLGIYGGSINKDQAQERMGHLRSSDFVLGGSGWISFKLGGGKNSSFAYVSVRTTLDHTEVARFGNHRFNQDPGTGNGEAYMFQYYYDLSAYLGQSLYFTISDTSSNEWCVLSADSFFTYYVNELTPDPSSLAINIVPQILGLNDIQNSIKNGNFSDDQLSHWSNINDVFRRDGDHVKSNKHHGDAATGVLRSSAFNVIGNKYIRLDWAGAIRWDKQLFISIKEVDTNIEVLRFVRRDNLGSKENGNFDNHMLDLSSLSEGKSYYMELSDNLNAAWGLIMMKNVRFITESEWNNVVIPHPGDKAVSISHIQTDFNYVLPYQLPNGE